MSDQPLVTFDLLNFHIGFKILEILQFSGHTSTRYDRPDKSSNFLKVGHVQRQNPPSSATSHKYPLLSTTTIPNESIHYQKRTYFL